MAHILVVDDSETLRTQLKKDLAGPDHVVYEACDGLDGLEKMAQSPKVELIICDVNMPNLDGLSMCTKIRQNEKYKDVKIFMLTTDASVDMKAYGKKIGVTAWITKPYNRYKLLAAVEKVCAQVSKF